MSDCIFCRIVNGELPAEKLYEDEHVIAFRDIHPVAAFHALVIPRKHIATLNDFTPEENALAGHLLRATANLAREQGLADQGYRVVINCNEYGGQVVYHVHAHVLGGQRLTGAHGLGGGQ